MVSLQEDAPRFVAVKKATLEKNQIRIAKEATSYEILVRYVIWQWLSRSLESIKKESAIFKSLLPYLKQEIDLQEQLQKEMENKHITIKDEVKNLLRIQKAELRKQLQEEIENEQTTIEGEARNLLKAIDEFDTEDSSGKKPGDEQRASNHNSNSTSSFNFSILSCLVILAVCLIFAKACSTSVMG